MSPVRMWPRAGGVLPMNRVGERMLRRSKRRHVSFDVDDPPVAAQKLAPIEKMTAPFARFSPFELGEKRFVSM